MKTLFLMSLPVMALIVAMPSFSQAESRALSQPAIVEVAAVVDGVTPLDAAMLATDVSPELVIEMPEGIWFV